MPINWNRLADPFPAEDVEWRVGSTTRDKSKGMALAYITARAIQSRLDEVFGPGGWKNEYRQGPDGGVICRIYFKDDAGDWCWREDGADNTDVEAVKGGLSSAMKRAGSALGIGRYLYKLPSQWVRLDERQRMAETPRIPAEFLPRTNGHAQHETDETHPIARRLARGAKLPPQVEKEDAGTPIELGDHEQLIEDVKGLLVPSLFSEGDFERVMAKVRKVRTVEEAERIRQNVQAELENRTMAMDARREEEEGA